MILMPECQCCGNESTIIQFFGVPDDPFLGDGSVISNYLETTAGYFSLGAEMNCTEDVDDEGNPILIGQGFEVDRGNWDPNIGYGLVFYRWVDRYRYSTARSYPFTINLHDGDEYADLDLTVNFRRLGSDGRIKFRLVFPEPTSGDREWPRDVLLVEGVDFSVEATDYRGGGAGTDISAMFSGMKVYIHSAGHYDSTENGEAAVTCDWRTGKMSPETASPRDNYYAVPTAYDYQRAKYSTIYDPTTHLETWTFDDELVLTFSGTATRRVWWSVWVGPGFDDREYFYSDVPIQLPSSVVLKYCPAVPTRTYSSTSETTSKVGPGWVSQFDIYDPNGGDGPEGQTFPATLNHTMIIMPPSRMPITHPSWYDSTNTNITPDPTPSAVFWWDGAGSTGGVKFSVSEWPPRFGNFPTSSAPPGVINSYPDQSGYDSRVKFMGFTLEQG